MESVIELAVAASRRAGGDEEDVRLAALGARTAFDRLVLRHQDEVVNALSYYLRNYEDAVDAAQEAFFKAFRSIRTFRGTCTFRTWILRIALNTARSMRLRIQAKKRGGAARRVTEALPGSSRESGAYDIEDPDISGAPVQLLERKEVKDALERAIFELEDEARSIIVLRDISGESYESIGAALRLPIGTVKSRVHRARLELRRKMAPYL